MPYIATDGYRYLFEHTCGRYHYGDQTLVRDCCVRDALEHKRQVLEHALTDGHPAYAVFTAAWNNLTDAEMVLVGDIAPAPGVANGFIAVPSTAD